MWSFVDRVFGAVDWQQQRTSGWRGRGDSVSNNASAHDTILARCCRSPANCHKSATSGASQRRSTTSRCWYASHSPFNPLECTGNYSAASNNLKLVHWPLIGGLLHLVQRGGVPPYCCLLLWGFTTMRMRYISRLFTYFYLLNLLTLIVIFIHHKRVNQVRQIYVANYRSDWPILGTTEKFSCLHQARSQGGSEVGTVGRPLPPALKGHSSANYSSGNILILVHRPSVK